MDDSPVDVRTRSWPLLNAAALGDTARLKALLDSGAGLEAKDDSGLTTLHWAAIGAHPDCVSALLSHGAGPNAKDGYGYTPVVYATRHADALRSLLKAGGDPNVADTNGVTPLMRAARNGRSDALRVLIESGADVRATGRHGQTALLFAAWSGHIDAVRALLATGADVNARDSTGRTVLDALTELEPPVEEMRKALRAAGGVESPRPPMKMRKCEPGSEEDKRTSAFPLMNAIVLGDTARFKQLLASGAGVNARDDVGRTPLHWAIWKMNLEYAKALLEAGADINAKDQGGWTPLADGVWHAELTRFLIHAGADVNGADDEGKTPLMLAAEEYTAGEQVRLLIAAGADVNARDRFGRTSLMFAVIPHHVEAVRALLAAGTDVNANNAVGQSALFNLKAFPPDPLPAGALPVRAGRMEMDALGKWESIRKMLLSAGAVEPDPEAIRRVREGSRGSCSFVPDCSRDGDPLVQAVLADDLATATRLLTAGANPTVALREALESRASASAIQLLISSGADINESQSPGGTPLMAATFYEHTEGVRLLLAAGVRVNVRDEEGCTALNRLSQEALIAPIPETDRQDIVTAWRAAEERTAKIRAMLVAAGGVD